MKVRRRMENAGVNALTCFMPMPLKSIITTTPFTLKVKNSNISNTQRLVCAAMAKVAGLLCKSQHNCYMRVYLSGWLVECCKMHQVE